MTPFRERNKTAIGAIGLAIILASVGAAFNADKLPFIGGGTVYQADFSEAAGLVPQDEVRVAGVKVGKVVGLGLAGDHVVVRFRIKGVTLGDASHADIRIKTVLGRKFVSLTSAGTGRMKPGDTIPLSRTSSPYDITDAFRGLATTVEQIDQKQLARAFETLTATFRDTPADVRASLTGLSRLSRTIASRDQALGVLLQHANGVSTILAQRDQDLVAFLGNSNLILEELRVRREAIHRLLVTTATLSDQLVGLVRENRAHLQPALHSLHGVVQVLKDNETNIDQALPRLAAFTRIFANNLGNGRWFDTFVQNLTNPTGFLPVGGAPGTTP